jgi:hypothetical protein
VLLLPEAVDVFLGGGRGGAKSYTLALLALRHVEQYGSRAHILYLRRSYRGVADFELLTRELFGLVYGTSARFNGAEHVWRFPNGGYLELGQLENHDDYPKHQGRSFSLLLVDEAGQYPTPDLLDIMRSNLRGPKGMPIRMIIAANPGGPGHAWLAKRYVFQAGPWQPFLEAKSKRTWIYAPSTYLDNPFIDRAQYREQLESACPDDSELLRAWVEGDWAVARGAYFASVLDERRNAVDPWPHIPGALVERPKPKLRAKREDWDAYMKAEFGKVAPSSLPTWDAFLAHDFGSSAPSVTYIVVKSPGGTGPDGRFYPRDSLILVDELATNKRDRLHEGLGWTVPTLGEEIVSMCKRWGVRPDGVADDAIFARTGSGAGSIAEEFRRCGVYFSPAQKSDRISGWQTMRRLLADAGKPDVPGLYVSRACSYFWQTVPYLPRDQRRVEDIDSTAVDHAADAARYACLRRQGGMQKMRLGGV